MPQLKLLEDFIALARTGSFVRAAELRHVTHPAFGRRIRALESWAGTPLVNRAHVPVTLTEQGEMLLKTACQVVHQLDMMRRQITLENRQDQNTLRIATGRTLARTLVTDWVANLRKGKKPVLPTSASIDITTGTTVELTTLLAQNKTDLLCCYEHPALSTALDPDKYQYMTMVTDKLVPVCQAGSRGQCVYPLDPSGSSVPLIYYAAGMSMARILNDRLEALPYPLVPSVRCDSLDAALSAALHGFGVAWLPWSLVMSECRKKSLTLLGGRSDHITFEVRLYRSRATIGPLAEAAWQSAQKRF
ncbi:MAG: LysR family transcriptional regulator [Alcaligenaceae bacterium]|nr:LysR family transcriptional regulator [Alcaligenaceae bacterium]